MYMHVYVLLLHKWAVILFKSEVKLGDSYRGIYDNLQLMEWISSSLDKAAAISVSASE